MEIRRRKFQGVLNILSFNRHFYVFGLAVLTLIIISHLLFGWPVFLFWITVVAFIYGLAMPLIVSAYVYDFSGYYNFDWLKNYKFTNAENTRILNINAGFDETSFILQRCFPESEINVFDFYNAARHTEAAIVRARKVSQVFPNTRQIASNHIPLPDGSADLIFLLSAAHEIRSQEEKIQFLNECRRVTKSTGSVVMVEHLRDFPNFVAFTVGFTHFFSKKTWKAAFREAGFSTIAEKKFTPFMSIFNCRP